MLILLAIGLALTYATAWTSAHFSTNAIPRAFNTSPPPRIRAEFEEPLCVAETKSTGCRKRVWMGIPWTADERMSVIAGRMVAGFPLHACESYVGEAGPLGSVFDGSSPKRRDLDLDAFARGIARPEPTPNPWSRFGIDVQAFGYPLRPIWPGFAIDVATYALLAWASFRTIALARPRLARRGPCVACGYDVHGLATCPECGTPQPSPNAAI